MTGFWTFFKHDFWWLLPLWGMAGYFGWKLGEALAIIEKLGEEL